LSQRCWSKAQGKQSSFNQFLRKKQTAEGIYQFLSSHLQAELEPEPDQVFVPDPEPGPIQTRNQDLIQTQNQNPIQIMLCGLLFHTHALFRRTPEQGRC